MFSNTYYPSTSGVVTSVALFRQGLMSANHEVHLIVPHYEDFIDSEPYIFRYPALDLTDRIDISLVLPFQPLIEPTVRGIMPDIIHSQHPVWMGDLAVTFAHELGVPLVFTYHTRYDEYAQSYVPIAAGLASKVAEEVVKRYMRQCTHIVAPTPVIRDLILREYQVEKPVSVVPSPVDLTRYEDKDPKRIRQEFGLDKYEVLLYIGRLAKEKGLDLLLNAFVMIVAERPQARLMLVGDGPYRRVLEGQVQRYGLSRKVIFTGVVPHEEIPDYAAAADLFVFTSLTDTQGLVLVEAMAAGVPAVAVEAPGPVDILARGGGLLVPAEEDAFAQAILTLLEDDVRRKELGEEAFSLAQPYAVSATTNRMLAVYEEALSTVRGK
ncbi:MAG: glycosyltransferase [Anaerolineaceae bacterium]|nr:MAG: glycosyltransferase [Anaerolineaceae bacterium]